MVKAKTNYFSNQTYLKNSQKDRFGSNLKKSTTNSADYQTADIGMQNTQNIFWCLFHESKNLSVMFNRIDNFSDGDSLTRSIRRSTRTCSVPVPAAVVGVVVLLVYIDGHLVVVVYRVDMVRHVDHVVFTVNTTSTFSQPGVHVRGLLPLFLLTAVSVGVVTEPRHYLLQNVWWPWLPRFGFSDVYVFDSLVSLWLGSVVEYIMNCIC